MASTPINQLDTVQYKLLAISALSGDIQKQVRQLWQDRFQHQEAFWVDVHEGQTTNQIANTVAESISRQGVFHISNLLITVFFDLTQPLDTVPIDSIFRLQTALSSAFHAIVPAPMVFAYTGKLAFADDLDEIRQRCAKVLEKECPVYLVGTPSLEVPGYPGAGALWKATILLADIMRRQITPTEILPNGSLGYIRYGEYNEDLWNRLDSRRIRLERELSAEGEETLTEALLTWMDKIRETICKEYYIDAKYQPIHPGMEVTSFFARRAAGRGKNEAFNAARMVTLNAMVETTKDLTQKIRESYCCQLEDAGQLLQSLLGEADVGLALKRDRDRMLRILSPTLDPIPQIPTVNLAYRADGYPKAYEQEMDRYITSSREKATEVLIRDLLEALQQAYKGIPEQDFQDQEKRLTQELKTVKSDLEKEIAPSREQFQDSLQQLVHGKNLPITPCNPTLGGGTSSHIVLCRTQEDAQFLGNSLSVGTLLYYLNHMYLKNKDGAPIKGIQVFAYDFTEERLKDLMG